MRRGIFRVFVWCLFLAALCRCLAPQMYASFRKNSGHRARSAAPADAGATVVLKAATSDYTQTTQTDADGAVRISRP